MLASQKGNHGVQDIVKGFDVLNPQRISQSLGNSNEYTAGFSFVSYTAQQKMYLPYLMNNMKQSGVVFEKMRVGSLESLFEEFDIVINCSGLGAKGLVPDVLMRPMRGQVLRISKSYANRYVSQRQPCFSYFCSMPLLQHTWDFGDDGYIIPNVDSIVLGGTFQLDDWNSAVDPADSEMILKRLSQVAPGLETCEVFSWL